MEAKTDAFYETEIAKREDQIKQLQLRIKVLENELQIKHGALDILKAVGLVGEELVESALQFSADAREVMSK